MVILFILLLTPTIIFSLMSFIFPLNIFAILGQIIIVALGILVFKRRRKKKRNVIFFSIPLFTHLLLLVAILGFSINSFRQHEAGDFERITLGFRKYLANKVGMTFLQPTADELKKWDKIQQQQKEMSQKRSQNRDKSKLKESKSAVFSVDDDENEKNTVKSNIKDPF